MISAVSMSIPCEGRAAIPMQKGLVIHVLYACMNIYVKYTHNWVNSLIQYSRFTGKPLTESN